MARSWAFRSSWEMPDDKSEPDPGRRLRRAGGGVPAAAARRGQPGRGGRARRARDAPLSTGYARLLGTGDEFVAEVPLGEDGGFRFFAAPGTWRLRVLAPGGRAPTAAFPPNTERSPRSR